MRLVGAEPEVRLEHRVIHGYRRAYRIAGDGPPLLLLHGIGDSSATWERVLPALAARHTVIAPDLLGHGDSDRPRADYAISAYACGMRDLLAVLGIDRVTVVGHSLGGGIAMQFAYQFPERAARLVVVGSGGVGREVHPVLRAATMPGAEVILPVVTSAPARFVVRRTAGWFARMPGVGLGPDTDYVVRRFDGLTTGRSRSAFLRTLRAGVDPRGQVVTMLDRCYLAAGVPTLIVWGRHDRIIPVGHGYVAHRAMPGSDLEVFEDSGHFPHRDEPERFAALVTRFTADTPAAVFDGSAWQGLLERPPVVPAAATMDGGLDAVTSGT